MKRLWLIDSGHGGLDASGRYYTPGKKQYHFEKQGVTAYEGAFNRLVAAALMELMNVHEHKYINLTPGYKDISLSDRISKANTVYRDHKNAVYLSLHSNASGSQISGNGRKAHGDEIYTSPNTTASDKLASVFARSYRKNLEGRAYRLDGTAPDHKQAKLFVLTKTHGPAILFENGFFDNWWEWSTWLNTEEGVNTYAGAIFEGIQEIDGTYSLK